jgi:hypothetical protein
LEKAQTDLTHETTTKLLLDSEVKKTQAMEDQNKEMLHKAALLAKDTEREIADAEAVNSHQNLF